MLNLANRIKLKIYLFFHPFLWGKSIQLNGMPKIYNPEKLDLGSDVSLNDRVVLLCGGGLHIGNRVTISNGVIVLTAGLNTSNYVYNSKQIHREHVAASVSIGDGTWICASVTITPGVTIADSCIVAAGSVVTKPLLEPFSLYGGVPAKLIKKLS